MAGDVIDGRIEGEYAAFVECKYYRGDLVGKFNGDMDGTFVGRGEVRTELGRELISSTDGERKLQGRVEGELEGTFEGQIRGEFEGTLQGEMNGRLEPL